MSLFAFKEKYCVDLYCGRKRIKSTMTCKDTMIINKKEIYIDAIINTLLMIQKFNVVMYARYVLSEG